ncbi:MAG TPA: DUF6370 family protein [Urbifossiella sp.]|jgi:hypothetical protein
MFRAMMIAAVVSAGAWTVGSEASPAKRSCCAPSAACCANLESCCFENFSDAATVLDEKPAKEVKLTGTLVCGSCKLKEAKKCTNVLQVKEKDKLVNYWLSDKGNDETYHESICGGGELKDVTVTGVVSEKDGKKMVKVSKFEVKK